MGRREGDLFKASLVGEVFRGSLEYIVNRMGVQNGYLKRCDKDGDVYICLRIRSKIVNETVHVIGGPQGAICGHFCRTSMK